MRSHGVILPGAGANRYLGLSDKLFALGDSVIIQALHRIALMPVRPRTRTPLTPNLPKIIWHDMRPQSTAISLKFLWLNPQLLI